MSTFSLSSSSHVLPLHCSVFKQPISDRTKPIGRFSIKQVNAGVSNIQANQLKLVNNRCLLFPFIKIQRYLLNTKKRAASMLYDIDIYQLTNILKYQRRQKRQGTNANVMHNAHILYLNMM